MIFSYGLLYLLTEVFEWEVSNQILAGMGIFFCGFLLVRKKLREKKFPFDLLVTGIIASILILFWIRGGLMEYGLELIRYWQEFSIYGKLNLFYAWPALFLLFLAGNGIYSVLCKRRLGKVLLCAGILTALIAGTIMQISWSVLSVAALLYVGLKLGFDEYLQWNQQTKNAPGKDKMILLLAALLLVVALPNREDPISWERVSEIWKETSENVNELLGSLVYGGTESDFGVESIGFSDQDDSFWGKIVHGEDRKMMTITANSHLGTEKTYFLGTIWDHYEENSWSKQTAESETEPNTDLSYDFELQEKLYYLYQSKLPSNQDTFFGQKTNYTLEYKGLRTQTVFLPQNCLEIELQKNQGELCSSGDNTIFSKNQKKESRYETTGFQMNLKNEELIAYLRKSTTDTSLQKDVTESDTLFQECVKALALNEEQIQTVTSADMEKKIKTYEEKVWQQDLVLPKTIPEEVYELADKITRDCDNDYDKMQAIVQYLKEDGGYSYTFSPEEAPKGEEEAAYFLLDSKQGYCSHFASATAILCRCEGIPARYVEGAVVSYQDDVREINIYGKDAHAWTQVYLKGFGWYAVDATPGYSTEEGNFKRVKLHHTEGGAIEIPGGNTPESQIVARKKTVKDKFSWKRVVVYTGMTAATSGVLVVLFFLLRMFVQKYWYHHSNNREKCEWCMQRILLHRKARSTGMLKGETLREYSLRVEQEAKKRQGEEQTVQLELRWSECLLLYEKIRYGGVKADDAAVKELEEIWKWEAKQRRVWKILHR